MSSTAGNCPPGKISVPMNRMNFRSLIVSLIRCRGRTFGCARGSCAAACDRRRKHVVGLAEERRIPLGLERLERADRHDPVDGSRILRPAVALARRRASAARCRAFTALRRELPTTSAHAIRRLTSSIVIDCAAGPADPAAQVERRPLASPLSCVALAVRARIAPASAQANQAKNSSDTRDRACDLLLVRTGCLGRSPQTVRRPSAVYRHGLRRSGRSASEYDGSDTRPTPPFLRRRNRPARIHYADTRLDYRLRGQRTANCDTTLRWVDRKSQLPGHCADWAAGLAPVTTASSEPADR